MYPKVPKTILGVRRVWINFDGTQNTMRPGAQPYVPPEMGGGGVDFWPMMYHCITIYNKNSNNVRV